MHRGEGVKRARAEPKVCDELVGAHGESEGEQRNDAALEQPVRQSAAPQLDNSGHQGAGHKSDDDQQGQIAGCPPGNVGEPRRILREVVQLGGEWTIDAHDDEA